MDVEDSASSENPYSGSDEPERPNRWTGPPSTWQALTAQERGLEASLVELRNRDLSIHLYNSFALKSKARSYREARNLKPSSSPSLETQDIDDSDDQELGDIEELAARGWAPPKVWTAWPLPPDQVPRSDEHAGPDDEDEEFTFKRKEKERPSRELEEMLVGTALKFAKERWQGRDVAREEIPKDEDGTSGGEEMDLEDELSTEEVQPQSSEEALSARVSADGGHGSAIKEPSQPPPSQPIFKPVLSADDDRSRDLLRPSVRHTLTQLDAVLMALHHARQTCHRYATDTEFSTDDDRALREVSMDESEPAKSPEGDERALSEASRDDAVPAKRHPGRPRKLENLASRPKPAADQESELIDADLWRTKRTHLGRPKRHYEALEGETEEEYLVRIARIQKKPLPSFASSRATTPERSPEKRSPVKRRRGSRKRERLGIRDWSEVLGSAALVGFPPDVIARTAQRCADLFGESVTMRHLIEAPVRAEKDHILTTYIPEEIPDLGYEIRASTEDSDEEDVDIKGSHARTPKRYLPGQHNWPCPMEGCPRAAQGFNHLSRIMRHLVRVHKLTDKGANELLDESQETHGGVHVDGFLKPIKNPKGLRGGDTRTRSRGRWAEGSIVAGEEPSVEKVEEEDASLPSES